MGWIRRWLGRILLKLVEDAMTERRKVNATILATGKGYDRAPAIEFCSDLHRRYKVVEDQCAVAADLTLKIK